MKKHDLDAHLKTSAGKNIETFHWSVKWTPESVLMQTEY